MTASHARNDHARRLFDGVADSYEGPAQALSLFQYGRWRRFLVSRLDLSPGALVLDLCTGTGLVAARIHREHRSQVVGLDLSGRMLAQAQRNVANAGQRAGISLVQGRAEGLPFADHSFDAVVFTFLLRYVEDPQATLREIARVLRPGGQLASLEFYVPRGPVLYPLWLLHTRVAMPLVARLISPGWREVGPFLGPSISAFYRKNTVKDLKVIWERVGIGGVESKMLSAGGAVVTWGRKEAKVED